MYHIYNVIHCILVSFVVFCRLLGFERSLSHNIKPAKLEL